MFLAIAGIGAMIGMAGKHKQAAWFWPKGTTFAWNSAWDMGQFRVPEFDAPTIVAGKPHHFWHSHVIHRF